MEMPDWNREFDLVMPLDGEYIMIAGSIKAKRHIFFEATEHTDRHSVDIQIDLCKKCFAGIITGGILKPDLPSSTGLGY